MLAQEGLSLSSLHPDGVATVHYLLFYDVVPDYEQRRMALRAAHLAHAKAACARGELLLGGAWPTPWTGRSCCFEETPRRRLRRSRWPILTLPMAL